MGHMAMDGRDHGSLSCNVVSDRWIRVTSRVELQVGTEDRHLMALHARRGHGIGERQQAMQVRQIWCFCDARGRY